MIETIVWTGEAIKIIDQTLLPVELSTKDLHTVEETWEAIKMLRVRGAPALGIASAFGVVLAAQGAGKLDRPRFDEAVKSACDRLRSSRPTAVNLFWALQRMEAALSSAPELSSSEAISLLERAALTLFEEDQRRCRALAERGEKLLEDGDVVLTHCNAGALATADFGTALGVLYAAHQRGKRLKVYADETRPLLQGARLTAWELVRAGIEVCVICDNMAAHLMRTGMIRKAIVGADRIARNGDVANKIGTYSVAVNCAFHGIPFYVAAPLSTIDLCCESGDKIPIEERDPSEIASGFGRRTVPEGARIYNPAFDVTPAKLVSAIITEGGIAKAPYGETLGALLDQADGAGVSLEKRDD